MSVEFVDTNVLVYAHDRSAGTKRERSVELVKRLTENGSGVLSIQVLADFYITATKKLGMASREAEEII
jgi:predicted nucleic acid-binding protein